MIPRIDGQTDDWKIVPESYVIGTEELAETVKGKGTNHDLEDLDVAVMAPPRPNNIPSTSTKKPANT